jgi:uncharacterized protein (TIGR02118 family)
MLTLQFWARKKDGMSPDEFRDYWLNRHATIARDGYPNLRGYRVDIVTKGVGGGEPLYDGVAELTWDDRDGFVEDMRSEAAKRGTDDLPNFTSAWGMVYVESHTVK